MENDFVLAEPDQLVLGKPGKVYKTFGDQLSDDEGFRQMAQEHYKSGGRKQAEIEYQLGRFVARALNDPAHEEQYIEKAIVLLRLHSEWFSLFEREFGRLPRSS
jgi:hypothetical protein